jgi:hypothetical protein
MTMLTVFTIPKAFKGPIRTIQFNAIESWLRLKPPCEVLLFGNEEGTAEAASQLGARHIPEIECSEYGTPLVSSAFHLAQKLSNSDLFCYANADMILLSDFVISMSRVEEKPFLVVGRRWDVNIEDSIDFSDPSWEPKLLEHVRLNGVLHRPQGLDYFVFSRGLFEEMPPFVVGRVGWDNWMVLHARLSRVPVVDATRAITAIHQNHDYSHLPEGEVTMRRGIEAQHNLELLGGRYRALDVRDATHILTPAGIRTAGGPMRLRRRIETLPELYPNLGPLARITIAFRAVLDVILFIKSKLNRKSY